MRGFLLATLALAAFGMGCAGKDIRPSRLRAARDPAPLASALETYNAGPSGVRLWGNLKVENSGTVDFGATVVEGVGLRFDAVAGPFSSLVVALACRTGESCLALVPGRGKAYVDESGRWGGFLGAALRGRVPRLEGSSVLGAWDIGAGRSALVFQSDGGWKEQIEFAPAGLLPSVVYFHQAEGPPDVRIGYGEFGETVAGHLYPGRVEVWLRDANRTYEIRFRRIEAVSSDVDPALFVLDLPSSAQVESVRGKAIWEETGIPIWPPLQRDATGPP